MTEKGEWKQSTYPKRMAAEIRKVKDQRRQEQQKAIKEAAAHITAELAQPIRRKAASPIQRTFKRRVVAIQNLSSLTLVKPIRFPYTHTKRARRYLRKHPGFPVNQYPKKGVENATQA